MEQINVAYLEKLARDLMFELSDQEAKELQEEFDGLLAQLALFDEIDTEGVERMVFPFEVETEFMREDVVDNVLSQSDALANVKMTKAGHVHVPKVVK